MNNFREIEQKGGLAQIKIDNGFIYDPKYDDPVEGYNRYCDGRLYCKTGYIPFGCHECIKIHSNSDDADSRGLRRRKTRRQRKSRRRQRKSRRAR